MSDVKFIPELRFPEFKNDGGFKNKPLKYFCDYWNGSGNEGIITDDGKYYLISLNSIDIEGNLKNDMKRVPNTDNSLKKGDLVMVLSDVAHGNFLGLTAIIPDNNYVLNQRMAGLGIKDFQRIDSRYLRLFINKNQKYFKKQGQGSSQQNLSKASVNDFPVLVPTRLLEQQKIASCLSSLDELIAAHNEKLEALKNHKKGLMQNLFPQEGESVPKVRFPEFENDGEWLEKRLGDVTTYFKGFAFKSENYTSSGRRIIRVSDMGYDHIKSEDNAIYINEIEAPNYEKWKLKEDDLILTTVGSKPPVYDSLVGRSIVVRSSDSGSLLNQNAVCLRASKLIQQRFLNTFFKRSEYISFIESIIRGNANQGSITLESLFEYQVFLPSTEEQIKIASCLSALDELIASQTDKIEQLHLHKKGLMQGLFPKIEN